jgi:hypothetical protein
MLAAAEAAQDDPAFAADRVGPEAGALPVDIQKAWDGRDRRAPRGSHRRDRRPSGRWLTTSTPGLAQCAGRDGARRRVRGRQPRGRRGGPRRRAHQRPAGLGQTPPASASTRPATTGRGSRSPSTDAGQVGAGCSSDRGGRRGAHHLEDEIVASPWSDSRRYRRGARRAGRHRVPGASPADAATSPPAALARSAGPPLADARFLPDVLEAAVRRAAAAWPRPSRRGRGARARGRARGDRCALRRRAQRRTRLVVRGRASSAVIVTVDAQAQPARMA